MKLRPITIIAAITLVIFVILSASTVHCLEFPHTLNPGTYKIEVPEGDMWTVFNDAAMKQVNEEFVNLKFKIEFLEKASKIELERVQSDCDITVNLLKESHEYERKLLNDRIDVLKKESKKTILGINRDLIFFILGVVCTTGIAVGVSR